MRSRSSTSATRRSPARAPTSESSSPHCSPWRAWGASRTNQPQRSWGIPQAAQRHPRQLPCIRIWGSSAHRFGASFQYGQLRARAPRLPTAPPQRRSLQVLRPSGHSRYRPTRSKSVADCGSLFRPSVRYHYKLADANYQVLLGGARLRRGRRLRQQPIKWHRMDDLRLAHRFLGASDRQVRQDHRCRGIQWLRVDRKSFRATTPCCALPGHDQHDDIPGYRRSDPMVGGFCV